VLAEEAEAAAGAAPRPAAAPRAGPGASVSPADAEALAAVMRTAATGEPALARAADLRLVREDARQRSAVAAALLLDGDPRVRAWACSQLSSLGDARALRPLILSAEH